MKRRRCRSYRQAPLLYRFRGAANRSMRLLAEPTPGVLRTTEYLKALSIHEVHTKNEEFQDKEELFSATGYLASEDIHHVWSHSRWKYFENKKLLVSIASSEHRRGVMSRHKVASVAWTDQLSYHPGPQLGLGLAHPNIYPIWDIRKLLKELALWKDTQSHFDEDLVMMVYQKPEALH
ncbi:hypothetical protein STEG23_026924 [Scotinomys teguina]